MFPVYFDGRIVNSPGDWFEQEKPELSPIYIRNRVKVSVSDYTGEAQFSAYHEEFILVEGVEAPMKEDQNWVSDYPLVVNPAKWPDPQIEEGRKLLASVDPTLPQRTADLIAANSDKMRKARRDGAARDALFAYHQKFEKKGRTIQPCGPYEKGSAVLTEDGALFYSSGWSSVVARYEVEPSDGKWSPRKKVCFPALYIDSERGLHVGESSETFSLPQDVQLPETVDTFYHQRMEGLKNEVERAKAEAFAKPVEITFPLEVAPLEKGYPEAKLPAELTVSRGAGTLRSTGSIGRWYEAACRMAEALGYTSTSSYSSNTGRTAYTKYVLVGQADPRSISRYITRVDESKGVLYAAKADIGRVIGTGGSNIKKIEQLTGRRWRIVPE